GSAPNAGPAARVRPPARPRRRDGLHPAPGWDEVDHAHESDRGGGRYVSREAPADERRLSRLRRVGTRLRGRHNAGATGLDVVRTAVAAALALVLAPSALAFPLRATFSQT